MPLTQYLSGFHESRGQGGLTDSQGYCKCVTVKKALPHVLSSETQKLSRGTGDDSRPHRERDSEKEGFLQNRGQKVATPSPPDPETQILCPTQFFPLS